jgi:tripartite-type tricarboxylate transporter receptor subunit TctC
VIEAGQLKLVAENFLGLSAPAVVDAGIANRFHAVMTEVLADPGIAKRLENISVYRCKMLVAEFNGLVADQVSDRAPLTKASGAKLN